MLALLSWRTAAALAVLHSYSHSFFGSFGRSLSPSPIHSFIHSSMRYIHAIRTCATTALHSGAELCIIEHAADQQQTYAVP